MKRPELVRSWIAAKLANHSQSLLVNLRGYMSMLDGNQAEVELLRGPSGTKILQTVIAVGTETIMKELGHETPTSVENSANLVRRAVRRVSAGGFGPEVTDDAKKAEPIRKRPKGAAKKAPVKRPPAAPSPSAPTPIISNAKPKAS